MKGSAKFWFYLLLLSSLLIGLYSYLEIAFIFYQIFSFIWAVFFTTNDDFYNLYWQEWFIIITNLFLLIMLIIFNPDYWKYINNWLDQNF